MPRDAARAELVARKRAALFPERHVIEGVVWVTDPGCGACGDAVNVVPDGEDAYTGTGYYDTLQRLEGKRVRITITVLADAPEGRYGA
jgi:hypothetical protein